MPSFNNRDRQYMWLVIFAFGVYVAIEAEEFDRNFRTLLFSASLACFIVVFRKLFIKDE